MAAGRFSRRLDDATANRLNNLDQFTDGKPRLQGDELRDALGGRSSSGALSQRLQTRQRLKQVAESQGPRLSASETRRALSGGSDGALSRRLNETRCNSFTAGTLVETEAGLAPIEEIDLGDNVLAEDPTTGEQGYYEVVALTNHPTNEILKVTLEAESQEAETLDSTADSGDNENIQLNSQTDDDPPAKIQNLKSEMEVTSDHPVYIEGQGWLNAENLSIGDRLRRADGGYARVLAIERVKLAEPEPVYNFTVKGLHTYFVLEVGVLVHNCFDGFDPWGPNRALDDPPGDMITPQNAPPNTRVTLSGPQDANLLNNLPSGRPSDPTTGDWGDQSTKLLWTIDDQGVHLVVEETPWPSSGRGIPSHTSLSQQAYAGGEAWRTGPNELRVSAASRAFGSNKVLSPDKLAEAEARYEAAIQYMRNLGLEVTALPFGQR